MMIFSLCVTLLAQVPDSGVIDSKSQNAVQEFSDDVVAPAAAPAQVPLTEKTVEPDRALRPMEMQDMSKLSLGEVNVGGTKLRYNLNVFGSTTGVLTALGGNGIEASFDLGGLDLLIGGSLGDLATLTTEFVLEAGGIDLERVELEIRSTNGFFATAGRSHTRVGYWNNAFHHGTWLQPTISRPHYLAFEDEGGLAPTHFIGFEVGKRFQLDRGTAVVRAGLGNGRGSIVDDIIISKDIDLAKTVLLSIYFENVGATGLYFGVFGSYDNIKAQPDTVRPALPDAAITEFTGHAHLAYRGSRLTLIVEGGAIAHQAQSKLWITGDAFAVAMFAFGDFSPYAGLEVQRTNVDADPYFSPGAGSGGSDAANFVEAKLGLRYDIRTWTAFKLEYKFLQSSLLSGPEHSLRLNWSFGL
jgi:hypothetical protein